MVGQKWALVIVVTVALLVWLRARKDAVERQELRQYLDKRGLKEAYPDLEAEGIRNIHDLEQLVSKDPKSFKKDLKRISSVLEVLREEKEAENKWTFVGLVWMLLKILFFGVLLIVCLLILAAYIGWPWPDLYAWILLICYVWKERYYNKNPEIEKNARILVAFLIMRTMFQWRPAETQQSEQPSCDRRTQPEKTGHFLDYTKTSVEWNCDEFPEVGKPTVITLQFKCRNGTPYCLQVSDNFQATINHPRTSTVIPHVVEPAVILNQVTIKVSFTTRLSGDYAIELKINGCRIGSGIITRTFRPGAVDASKTIFLQNSSTIVVTRGLYHSMQVIPKDVFGNPAIISQEFLTTEIRRGGPRGKHINPECVVDLTGANRYEILLKVEESGHYVGSVKYHGQTIGPPCITIICLSDADTVTVDKYINKKTFLTGDYYEAHLLTQGSKPKKVFCYISPKQFQVIEYFIGIIAKRSYTCKVCPSTRFMFDEEPGVFTLNDGYQQSLTFHSTHREVLAATYYRFLLKNIGGSEKFQDKRSFFYSEVKKLQAHGDRRQEQRLLISRDSLLETAMQSTHWFRSPDWYKKFIVKFKGERGLDWGGVSREFFELLCVQLFDPRHGLFMRFKDDPQALVHPMPASKRPNHWKLKHYEFAGRVVGKCLYESALGNPLFVKARFTRSFLAQIIGLRINYKYFESDNPELYTTKVQYIRDNDVTDLDLVFAEEEYSTAGGGVPVVVPLIDKGAKMKVTNQNKTQYLNLLAQYQLAKSVKEEVEHFLKGLNDIVPDNLLSMFDENELELLMCGLSTVSFKDLKGNAIVSGSDVTFRKVVSWFWSTVSGFTQEEMAKLLQFVTGCSQLPPGGFKELRPPFTITHAPTHSRLPTAHTCFNQLCLPTYDSYEQFQQSLTLAINEGAEEFGLE